MSLTLRQLSNPTDEELAIATNVLYEAFKRRYFLGALGGNTSLVEPFIHAHLKAGIVGGEVHVAEVEGVGIVGVTLWLGPGQKFLSTPEQRNSGWNDIMSKLEEKYRQWWDYFLKLCNDAPDKYYGVGKQLQSYHLQLIGVLPAHQRKGYGTALMKSVEGRAAAEGKDVVLETVGDSAVPIYRAMGFEVFGPEPVTAVSGVVVNAWWFQKKFGKDSL